MFPDRVAIDVDAAAKRNSAAVIDGGVNLRATLDLALLSYGALWCPNFCHIALLFSKLNMGKRALLCSYKSGH